MQTRQKKITIHLQLATLKFKFHVIFLFFTSNNRGRTWIPMQFYSSQCETVYRRPKDAKISRDNEQVLVFFELENNFNAFGKKIFFINLFS